MFCLVVYSANDHNNLIWTRPDLGVKNSILIAGGNPNPWAITCLLPRHISRELGWNLGSWNSTSALALQEAV